MSNIVVLHVDKIIAYYTCSWILYNH